MQNPQDSKARTIHNSRTVNYTRSNQDSTITLTLKIYLSYQQKKIKKEKKKKVG